MKALRYFTAVFTIAALASCNDDLEMGGFASDPNAVRISATVGKIPTRSNPVGDATTVKQFNAGDKMYVSSNSLSAVYEFDGTSWSPIIPDQYLTWDCNRQNFTAYYPDTYRGSGNVPQEQNTDKLIVAADYMKFEGDLEMQETVSFTMSRQTARVIIRNDFSWNDEYMEGGAATHKVDAIMVNCIGVSDIKPYQSGNYYALVNPGSADPDAAFLTITVSPIDGQSSSVTHTVRGIPEFEPGYSYEYDITIGKSGVTISDVTVEDWSTGSIIEGEGSADDNVESYFSVTAPDENFNYAGGTKNYTVESYAKKEDGSQTPMPWSARFVRKLEDGTYEEIKQGDTDYPTWITNFTDNGIGTDANDICAVTVESSMISNNHYNALKNATPVNGIYNLSNVSGGAAVENTANCYIINAAGTYSIPLVYGNAIKNGTDNQSAYKSTATGDLALEQFLNHRDEPITSPYIAAHEGCTPGNAVLVWQDADNLVSNIKFVDGGSPEAHRITFDVAQSSIKQGNAIIAIRDAENTILWSWHIWVTDYKPLQATSVMNSYDPTETQKDKKVWTYDNSKSFTFMGVPLGWCDAESAAGNEVIMQFIQIETGTTQEVTVKQDPLSTGGNCTFYQWGRKDPMLPGNGLDNVDKQYNGNYTFTKGVLGKVTLGTAIQNPHKIYDRGDEGYADWYSGYKTIAGKQYFHNLWDANNISTDGTSVPTTKTVYDPSPVGYAVAPIGAFSGFTFDGNNTGDDWTYRNKFNTPINSMDDVNAVRGWLCYCKGMNNQEGKWDTSGGVIYYPAIGAREHTEGGNLRSLGVSGNSWSSTNGGTGFGRLLGFNFELMFITPTITTPTAQGMPVRPVRE